MAHVMDFTTLSLDEQLLLLEEASLVFYIDEEDDSITYVCDEDDNDSTDDQPSSAEISKNKEKQQKILNDLKTIFQDRFHSPSWEVASDEIVPVEVGTIPKKQRAPKKKWKNVRPLNIGVMNLADQSLPNYSKKKYPNTILITDTNKNVLDVILDKTATTSDIGVASAPPTRFNKTCTAYFNTGYCRFGFLCKFNHDVILCQQNEKNRCNRGSKCKFFHRSSSVSEKTKNLTHIKKLTKQQAKPFHFKQADSASNKSPPVKQFSSASNKSPPVKQFSSASNKSPPVKQFPSASNKSPPVKQFSSGPKKSPFIEKKIFMCKYVLTNRNCPFQDRCNFSHSREELENYIVPCSRGSNCNSVIRQVAFVNRNNQQIQVTRYLNNGNARCPTLHPGELVANYIKRLTLTLTLPLL